MEKHEQLERCIYWTWIRRWWISKMCINLVESKSLYKITDTKMLATNRMPFSIREGMLAYLKKRNTNNSIMIKYTVYLL